jgi:hypothetical protein
MGTLRLAGLLTLCGFLVIGGSAQGDDGKDESGHGRRGSPPPWADRGNKEQKEFFKKLEEQRREARKRYEEQLREDEKRHREADREYRKRIEEGRKGSGYAPNYPYLGGDQSWIGVPGLDAGYDQWRRNADRAYGRGDFYVQGWQQRPYPYGYYPPQPSPYGWPR